MYQEAAEGSICCYLHEFIVAHGFSSVRAALPLSGGPSSQDQCRNKAMWEFLSWEKSDHFSLEFFYLHWYFYICFYICIDDRLFPPLENLLGKSRGNENSSLLIDSEKYYP